MPIAKWQVLRTGNLMNLNGIKLTWLGHATFRIETPGGKTMIVDPWIMGNPACPEKDKDVKKVDVLLCTHGHGDHIGDAVEIVKKHDPVVVGILRTVRWMQKKGAKQTSPDEQRRNANRRRHQSHHGACRPFLRYSGWRRNLYGGEACGYVIEFANGVKIYHAGDTNVFGDMQIIRELYAPEIVMLPIGDHLHHGAARGRVCLQSAEAEDRDPHALWNFSSADGNAG